MWKDLKFDQRSLVGGRQFLVPIELARNGSYIKTLAHIDGGANIFGAIKTSLAYQLSQRFGVSFIRLQKPIIPTGYNGEPGEPISFAILLSLTIDRRRVNFPFLVTNLGSTDVLIGRKFLQHYDLKQAYGQGKNKIEWPLDMPIIPYFNEQLFVDLNQRKEPKMLSRTHQEDANRRDSAMGALHASANAPVKSPIKKAHLGFGAGRPSSFMRDLKSSLNKMEKFLTGKPEPTESPQSAPSTRPIPPPTTSNCNISCISAFAFSALQTRYEKGVKAAKKEGLPLPDNFTFIASVHDIDRERSRRAEIAETNEVIQIAAVEGIPIPDALQAKYDDNVVLVRKLLPARYSEFEELFYKQEGDKLAFRRPGVDHKIHLATENNLSIEPLRRLTDEQLTEVKSYILDNLHKGFIEPSNAPFAAPILFTKKSDGSMRLCIDYRKLNELTKKDPYPLPLIDEMLARITKAKVFTKIDIQQAFNRVRMSEESEDLTSFRTRYGMYKYKVLPFGLTNGPATFQRFINDILMEHLDDFCSAYLDDILIYSENDTEHEIHVKKILSILKKHGLEVDIKKCEFHVTKTKFLGFIISTKGIEVNPEKIAIIQDWRYAANVRGVQSFLGFCNFYRRFIAGYSRICRPLTALTGKDVPFVFEKKQKDAWEALRKALLSAPILCHYDPHKQTRLETDSSDGVVAGVLSQLQEDDFYHPVGFFSKTMIDAELNYPIYDKELLAIFRSFKNYKPELLGAQKNVHVYTDHRALEYFMTTKDLSARQARWAEFFADFHFTVMYRSGITNTLADTLSRRDQDISPLEARQRAARKQQMLPDDKLDPQILQELAAAKGAITLVPMDTATPEEHEDGTSSSEEEDGEVLTGEPADPTSVIAYDMHGYTVIDDLLQANKNSPSLEAQRIQARNNSLDYELRQNKLFFQGRLVIPLEPPELRASLIRHIHEQPCVAHAGIGKMKLLIGRKYYWKAMGTDIQRYISNCRCTRMKARRDKTPGFLKPLPIPSRPYQHLTMDFTELPLDEDGHDFALVVMDRLSKKPLSVPCHKTITAKGLAALFLVHWVRHFGMPDSIVSDRGAQFVSVFWQELCRILGTKVKLTTAYNPNVDGQTEVMNQYIKQRLRPFCSYYQDNWGRLLPLMDIAQLTLPHESLGNVSPFQVLNGYEARTSWDMDNPRPPRSATEKLNRDEALHLASRAKEVVEYAQSSIAQQQTKMERLANLHRRPVDWEVGDEVLVSTKNWKLDRPSRKLSDKWYGPVKVVDKVGESWKLDLPADWSIHPIFHSHSLRKHVSDPLPGQRRPEPAPIQLLPEQMEWEVERIEGSRLHKGVLQYQINWKGADEDLEWYPCSDAMTAPHLLQSFHRLHPTAKGPPRALPAWLQAYNEGREDYTELEDDRPMTATARTQFFGRGG